MLVECRIVDGLGEGRQWSRSCPCACEKGHNEHKATQMQWIEPRVSEEMLVWTIWHSITPFPRADASRLSRVVVVLQYYISRGRFSQS